MNDEYEVIDPQPAWFETCAVRNPVFIDPEGVEFRRINCEAEHPDFGWLPFTAHPADPELQGVVIHARALAMGPAPYVPPDPAVLLERERAGMVCTMLQLRLAGGEDCCIRLDAWQADPETPWATREAMRHVTVPLRRTGPLASALVAALDFTDAQMDNLFRTAMQIEV